MAKRKHKNNDSITPEMQAQIDKSHGDDTRQEFHIWRCETCPEQPEFSDFPAFKTHLIAAHAVDTKTAKVEQRETMHLDGTKYYQTNYACQIIGMDVTYTEAVRQRRTGEDALYWMDI